MLSYDRPAKLCGYPCTHILNMYAHMHKPIAACACGHFPWWTLQIPPPYPKTHFLVCHLHLVCYGNRGEVCVFVWRSVGVAKGLVEVWNTLRIVAESAENRTVTSLQNIQEILIKCQNLLWNKIQFFLSLWPQTSKQISTHFLILLSLWDQPMSSSAHPVDISQVHRTHTY